MNDEDYEIVSVEPTDPPGGMEGDDWYCYVIGQGDNEIRGYTQGKAAAVKRNVKEIVLRLNERRRGKSGRVHLTMSPQEKKVKGK
ncbi:MAG: hypothetical protein QNI99_08280 [Woeseiaceae bacterium]|nr:hypothetical protein [Woeseiaceae bacterium]